MGCIFPNPRRRSFYDRAIGQVSRGTALFSGCTEKDSYELKYILVYTSYKRFTQDPIKAASNLGDHRVSFDEAEEVFADPRMLDRFDGMHSDDERRYMAIGLSSRRLLVVIFTEPDANTVRLIAAGKATRKDKEAYEQE